MRYIVSETIEFPYVKKSASSFAGLMPPRMENLSLSSKEIEYSILSRANVYTHTQNFILLISFLGDLFRIRESLDGGVLFGFLRKQDAIMLIVWRRRIFRKFPSLR